MGEVIIQLQIDPDTKKKNIRIKYISDDDSMPMEHEEDHRRIVDQLIQGGALKANEVGDIIVEREEESGEIQREGSSEGLAEREAVEESG